MIERPTKTDDPAQELFLRELGIYSLPDGREFVAHAAGEAGYSLYTPSAWKTFGMAEYRVHPDGKILSKGIPTRWGVADLRDTGRSVKYLNN
jgi:hypothetical protein